MQGLDTLGDDLSSFLFRVSYIRSPDCIAHIICAGYWFLLCSLSLHRNPSSDWISMHSIEREDYLSAADHFIIHMFSVF